MGENYPSNKLSPVGRLKITQDAILGYFYLRNRLFAIGNQPRTVSWVTFSPLFQISFRGASVFAFISNKASWRGKETAGPSTALRSGRDDNFVVGIGLGPG